MLPLRADDKPKEENEVDEVGNWLIQIWLETHAPNFSPLHYQD